MNMHLNKKNVIASAAIATAALGAIGAAAYAWKKHRDSSNGKSASSDSDEGDLANIGPGEVNPYVDTPTDPSNQN